MQGSRRKTRRSGTGTRGPPRCGRIRPVQAPGTRSRRILQLQRIAPPPRSWGVDDHGDAPPRSDTRPRPRRRAHPQAPGRLPPVGSDNPCSMDTAATRRRRRPRPDDGGREPGLTHPPVAPRPSARLPLPISASAAVLVIGPRIRCGPGSCSGAIPRTGRCSGRRSRRRAARSTDSQRMVTWVAGPSSTACGCVGRCLPCSRGAVLDGGVLDGAVLSGVACSMVAVLGVAACSRVAWSTPAELGPAVVTGASPAPEALSLARSRWTMGCQPERRTACRRRRLHWSVLRHRSRWPGRPAPAGSASDRSGVACGGRCPATGALSWQQAAIHPAARSLMRCHPRRAGLGAHRVVCAARGRSAVPPKVPAPWHDDRSVRGATAGLPGCVRRPAVPATRRR